MVPRSHRLCCVYMDARDKAEFAAEGVFFNSGRMKNQERLSFGTGLCDYLFATMKERARLNTVPFYHELNSNSSVRSLDGVVIPGCGYLQTATKPL